MPIVYDQPSHARVTPLPASQPTPEESAGLRRVNLVHRERQATQRNDLQRLRDIADRRPSQQPPPEGHLLSDRQVSDARRDLLTGLRPPPAPVPTSLQRLGLRDLLGRRRGQV